MTNANLSRILRTARAAIKTQGTIGERREALTAAMIRMNAIDGAAWELGRSDEVSEICAAIRAEMADLDERSALRIAGNVLPLRSVDAGTRDYQAGLRRAAMAW